MKRLPLLFAAAVVALAPRARAYDTIRFLDPIKDPALVRPVAVASSGDRLYVLDGKTSALSIFDAAGKLVKSVGGAGSQGGPLRDPRGVAVGPNGYVYVADTGNNRVQMFDHDGGFLYAFGEKGAEPGRLRDPESIAVGADGRIFVADTGNDRVQVFTQQGILLFVLGRSGKLPGQFKSPRRVAVDPSDDLYVLDSGNGRVQKFDAAAKFVKEYAMTADDMAVDAYGFLYILDAGRGKVVEAGPDGAVLGKFGSEGAGTGQFKRAAGLALAPDGALVVADAGNARIQRVELANKLKTAPLPLNAQAKMSVSGPSAAWPYAATQLAPRGDSVYAYLPQGGPFVLIGADGKKKSSFGALKGKGGDVVRSAGGIAASDKMGFLAADTADSRLQRFTLEGQWLSNLGQKQGVFDSKAKEGRLNHPNGVAVNEAGTIYVADTGNKRIDAFSPDGVFLFAIGPKVGNFLLQEPVALAWDKAGFLYFVDKGLKRVFKCEPSGALLASWGGEGTDPGQFEAPVSVAFDGQGYLYTLDEQLKRVSVHTREGQWLADFFAGGAQERELLDPVAVAVRGHTLLVADKGKGKIVSYDLHPQLGSPVGISSSTKEGIVTLGWRPSEDPWADGYQVFRSSLAGGPFQAVGLVKDERFQDSDVTPYEKYWYRVATVAKTKDVGPWSRPVETFIAAAFNRAPVEISTVTLGNIFAAKYKWYLKNPVGKVTVTNNVNVPFLNVKVTFKLKDYMDFGTDTEIRKLEPKQSVEVPLMATLNNKVLEVTEDTPIQAEFSLSYFDSGESRNTSLAKPLRLYSRNAITWDDSRKIATFITYKDEPVKNLKPAVTADFKSEKAAALNPELLKALRIWNALAECGIKFAANPANPFETAHDDPNFPVDYTQYPRETLKRRTGQCSDLTSLYAALLTDNEVRVALLDYPGHITLMFDTEADDAAEAGLTPDMLVEHDGTMWVPVEVTYVGKPFNEAVSKAAYAYKAEAEKGRVKVIDVGKALEEYEPVTMPPADSGPPPLDMAALEKRYDDQVGLFAKERYRFLKKTYEDELGGGAKDAALPLQLGIVEYQYGNRDAAAAQFQRVLAADPKNAAALNDLASVEFLKGEYPAALKHFKGAAEADPGDASVWLNLLKTAVKLDQAAAARQYAAKVAELAPGYKPLASDLVKRLKE